MTPESLIILTTVCPTLIFISFYTTGIGIGTGIGVTMVGVGTGIGAV